MSVQHETGVCVTCLRLAEPDLRAVLDAAEDVDAATGEAEDAVPRLLDALAGLVRSDVVFWNWISLRSGVEELALVHAPCGRLQQRAPIEPWLEHLAEHPIMSGRFGPVTAISDVLSPGEFERSWLYQQTFRVEGLRYEIGMELSHGADEMSVVVFSRGPGQDFSSRDHLVLRLVRPHVDAAMRRLCRPALQLTDRQLQVLDLVRDGLTDAQVARRRYLRRVR